MSESIAIVDMIDLLWLKSEFLLVANAEGAQLLLSALKRIVDDKVARIEASRASCWDNRHIAITQTSYFSDSLGDLYCGRYDGESLLCFSKPLALALIDFIEDEQEAKAQTSISINVSNGKFNIVLVFTITRKSQQSYFRTHI